MGRCVWFSRGSVVIYSWNCHFSYRLQNNKPCVNQTSYNKKPLSPENSPLVSSDGTAGDLSSLLNFHWGDTVTLFTFVSALSAGKQRDEKIFSMLSTDHSAWECALHDSRGLYLAGPLTRLVTNKTFNGINLHRHLKTLILHSCLLRIISVN